MFDPGNVFNSFFVIPILNILMGFYNLLLFLKIPDAFGFSLILLTVVIRLILYPLTKTQLKSSHKLSRLKPHLDRLAQIHKDDKQRLHQEQLKLYQQEGINPAAGCLPLILQMPILIGLYNLFFQLLNSNNMEQVVSSVNKVVYFSFLKIQSLDLNFLGLNLASKPSEWQKFGWWLLAVPVLTAILQYWQTKIMVLPTQQIKNNDEKTTKEQKDEANNKKEEDVGAAMQKQMAIMMPLMIGFFAYSFPLGLSLYWNTFTLSGIIQQYQFNKEMQQENEEKQK